MVGNMVVTAGALLQAVEKNDVAELRKLVKKDASNVNGLAGKTQLAALHVCAVKVSMQRVWLLDGRAVCERLTR